MFDDYDYASALCEEEHRDFVNHPPHYTAGDIECIDAIKASMSPLEYHGYLKGNALKYIWRYSMKENPVQDLEKAIWYLNRLREHISGEGVS